MLIATAADCPTPVVRHKRAGMTAPATHARVPGNPYCWRMPGERVLVTGCAGHLGEALVRVLREQGREVVGLDLLDSPFTTVTGSITDRDTVRSCLAGVGTVVHPATLHKPHVGSHDRQAFVDTNITGTLILLEEAVSAGVESFVFTSTTSAFGRALSPGPGAPAAWITEDVTPVPKNIYGVTKTAAENLCELIHAGCSPTRRRSTSGDTGGCSARSTGSTSTPGRARTSAGLPATTSAGCSMRSRRARTRAARSRGPSAARAVGAKGYHPVTTGPYTVR
jgi:NAD(P)-dependent dehydrogenase (short-subunit alcohol dehydrogenase family)